MSWFMLNSHFTSAIRSISHHSPWWIRLGQFSVFLLSQPLLPLFFYFQDLLGGRFPHPSLFPSISPLSCSTSLLISSIFKYDLDTKELANLDSSFMFSSKMVHLSSCLKSTAMCAWSRVFKHLNVASLKAIWCYGRLYKWSQICLSCIHALAMWQREWRWSPWVFNPIWNVFINLLPAIKAQGILQNEAEKNVRVRGREGVPWNVIFWIWNGDHVHEHPCCSYLHKAVEILV